MDGHHDESNDAGRHVGDGEYQLSEDQLDAVATLASSNVYARQSKWRTFRELPAGQRWAYFRQHFLAGVVVAAVLVALAGSLLGTMLFHGPDPVVGIQAINMQDDAARIDRLKAGFVKAEHLDDDRLVDAGATMLITADGSTGSGMMDDSSKLMAMTAAKQIQVLIAPGDDAGMLVKRNLFVPAKDVLTTAQLAAVQGSLLGKDGKPVTDPSEAWMLDLSGSEVWDGLGGASEHAVMAFCNVTDQDDLDWVVRFFDYLRFK